MPRYYRNETSTHIHRAVLLTLVFLVALTGVFYGWRHFRNRTVKEQNLYFSACALNYKDTKERILEDTYTDFLEIRDYLYYGETLNLYQDAYSINEKDGLIGRTVMLNNLCNDTEAVYLINGKADGQIPVEYLEDGLYSVSIFYDSVKRRTYSPDVIYDTFYTVRRDGVGKKITLLADATLLDTEDESNILDQNYLFLKVETVTVPEEVYDVVIDPGHSSRDAGNYNEYGGKANDLIEAEETYKIAMVIKEKLESYGLKVLITRNDATEVVNTYGEGGRLARAYASKAKYYLDLQMLSAANTKLHGTQIVHSSFTSSKMAVAVLNYLLTNTELVSTGNKGTGKISGIVPSGVIDGYDGRMVIRESGGRILGAAMFSEKARTENASFALDARYGLQTLTIEYIYMTNPQEAEAWKENYVLYGEKTAEALASYLEILE